MIEARPCPCGDKICKMWVIGFGAELRLPEKEAKRVAALLNLADDDPRLQQIADILGVK